MPKSTRHTEETISIPISEMRWKEQTIEYVTILGTSSFTAMTLDWDGPMTVRPDEEERLSRAQAIKFLKRVISGKLPLEGPELRFILMLLRLKQADLSRALAVSPSTISNLMKGEAISPQTSRQMAVLLELELEQPGFFKRLDKILSDDSEEGLLKIEPELMRA